jgi:hypothetical protein
MRVLTKVLAEGEDLGSNVLWASGARARASFSIGPCSSFSSLPFSARPAPKQALLATSQSTGGSINVAWTIRTAQQHSRSAAAPTLHPGANCGPAHIPARGARGTMSTSLPWVQRRSGSAARRRQAIYTGHYGDQPREGRSGFSGSTWAVSPGRDKPMLARVVPRWTLALAAKRLEDRF